MPIASLHNLAAMLSWIVFGAVVIITASVVALGVVKALVWAFEHILPPRS